MIVALVGADHRACADIQRALLNSYHMLNVVTTESPEVKEDPRICTYVSDEDYDRTPLSINVTTGDVKYGITSHSVCECSNVYVAYVISVCIDDVPMLIQKFGADHVYAIGIVNAPGEFAENLGACVDTTPSIADSLLKYLRTNITSTLPKLDIAIRRSSTAEDIATIVDYLVGIHMDSWITIPKPRYAEIIQRQFGWVDGNPDSNTIDCNHERVQEYLSK